MDGRRLSVFRLAALLMLLPVAAAAAYAQEPERIEVANGGFETAGADGLPEGWRLATGEPLPGGVVFADHEVYHGGGASLLIANADMDSVTLESGLVSLQVGHLYRLRGWVRTEGVRSDPTTHYPTAVAACLTMASFPFTNHSPTLGATAGWTEIETLFIATRGEDRVRLHLGYNGGAVGRAWFDDLSVEEVDDIGEYIPPETVSWFGPAYRYDDRGWIFVHIEGEPYARGYQYGYLLPGEISEYIRKLGVRANVDNPERGWEDTRFVADAVMLRKFDEEYLIEMRGIADGAARAGCEVFGRPIDFLDIVTINSVIDIDWMRYSLAGTAHPLTGRNFISAEDELLLRDDEHHCTGFVATGPATTDGRFVFGQIFMWSGYTGVHWNVICDVEPSSGQRLVYETFPGGIHSGADFYMNSAGIVIGETTTSQTPYDAEGTPMSNRIRRAAQYAESIDDVVDILSERNNGMYTNDWLIADAKTDEVAIFLLGTHASRLWRSGDGEFPGGTEGFFWSNNNNKDDAVRREYIPHPENAPFDLIFTPWNRDLAFNEFFREQAGRIDAIAGVNLWATSPINRAHACDGKITSGEMTDGMVFLAHFGKVTLREKFPAPGSRRMPDLPGAEPHLSLGYSIVSPVFITEKLREARARAAGARSRRRARRRDLFDVAGRYELDHRYLWRNTVLPASGAENWLVSGSAAYWRMLRDMPSDSVRAAEYVRDELASLNCSFLYTVSHEDDLAPVRAERVYDRYGHYRIPRIKGVFALHQLRLLLGNDLFLRVMSTVYERYANREITNAEFVAVAEEVSGRGLGEFLGQWIERTGLPAPEPSVSIEEGEGGTWIVNLEVRQAGEPYRLVTTVGVETENEAVCEQIEVDGPLSSFSFAVPHRPLRVVFNPGNDFPVERERFYIWGNFIDDFHNTLIVYGTSRQIECNHTLALRWQETLADAYVEILPPLRKDGEVTAEELASHDLIVLGHPTDNSLVERMAGRLPIEFGRNMFRFDGGTYADPDDGLFLILPNPYNPERVLYLIVANSAMQLYRMTRTYESGLPAWAVYKGAEVVASGYHPVERFVIDVP